MKKWTIAVLAAVLLLTGCSAAESSTAKLIDPMTFGSVLSGQAPSTLLPPGESGKEKSKPAVNTAESTTIFTLDVVGELRNGRYQNEEFGFAVAAAWRDHFEVEITDPSSGALNLRAFIFYFTDAESGVRLPVLRIDAVEQSIAEIYGQSKIEIGRTASGNYIYYLSAVNPEIPSDFALRDDFVGVYREALAEGKFQFEVTA